MRQIPFLPIREEDRGLLGDNAAAEPTSPLANRDDTKSLILSLESLPLSEGDRYEAAYFQRQLNNATAQRHLADMQVEEAMGKLQGILSKYQA